MARYSQYRGGWEAGVGLNPLLEPFGLAIYGFQKPKHAWLVSETFPYHWGKFHTHAFHVAPSVGPIVSVMNLQGQQNSL